MRLGPPTREGSAGRRSSDRARTTFASPNQSFGTDRNRTVDPKSGGAQGCIYGNHRPTAKRSSRQEGVHLFGSILVPDEASTGGVAAWPRVCLRSRSSTTTPMPGWTSTPGRACPDEPEPKCSTNINPGGDIGPRRAVSLTRRSASACKLIHGLLRASIGREWPNQRLSVAGLLRSPVETYSIVVHRSRHLNRAALSLCRDQHDLKHHPHRQMIGPGCHRAPSRQRGRSGVREGVLLCRMIAMHWGR